ncbi:MAG: hypothetical protein JWN61_1082 [Pseudonocardiales bacterium]|nr:hypothetical protein [Pseudonocardiales bacterium]
MRDNGPMPRRHRRADDAAAPSGGRSMNERIEEYRGTEYRVRSLSGASASGSGGPYRCPGCDQLVPGRSPHIVAWRDDDAEATDRRHWHTVCWANRATRGPTTRR